MAFVFDKKRPYLTAMIQEDTLEGALNAIVDSHYDGADAFGIQLEDLRPEYRNLNDLKKIFDACMGKPIYITSYRNGYSTGFTDEQCVQLLLLGVEAGADLCDVMADMYDPQPYELTEDPQAVEKQKELIDRIHDMGAQVLMSSHTHCYLEPDRVIYYAKAHKMRGADVAKIVNDCGSDQQLRAIVDTTFRLNEELEGLPYLYLCGGSWGRVFRQIGPQLGVCMYLCAQRHKPGYSRMQPTLRSMKQVRDNMIFLP